MSTRVEDFFSIDEKTSHSKIAELSIAYLLQFDDDSLPLTKATLHSMPLAQYAAEQWIDHAKSGGMDHTVLQLTLRLLTSESAPFKNWIRIHDIEGPYGSMDLIKNDFYSPLYYSSLTGMDEASDCLLQKMENVNAKGGIYGNPLQAASCKGHEAIVKLLLENGAEVNAKGGIYKNALRAALYEGNEAIVKLLLKNGADTVDALETAILQGGNEAIMELLLENGAEVNAKGGKYGNALQAALYRGDEAIVELLLENGAEVNAI